MTPEQPNYQAPNSESAPPVLTEQELLQELSEPRRMATDVPPPQATELNTPESLSTNEKKDLETPENEADTHTGAQSNTNGTPPPFHLAPPPDAEPLFPNAPVLDKDEEEEAHKAAEPKVAPLASNTAKRKLQFFLKLRDRGQSKILANMAGGVDAAVFAMSDEDFEILEDAYLPIMEMHGGKIPWWFEIIIAESVVLGSKLLLVRNIRIEQAKTQQLISDPERVHELRQTVAQKMTDKPPTRSRYTIDADGFYEYDTFGSYIRKEERTEKASIDDIKEIVLRNRKKRVQDVFNLTDEQIDKIYEAQ